MWYSKNLKEEDKYISYSSFCNDTSYGSGNEKEKFYYGANNRMNNSQPSLKCPIPKDSNDELRLYGGKYKLKIGLLSVDELNLIGITNNTNEKQAMNNYYIKNPDGYGWTMSPGFSNKIQGDNKYFRSNCKITCRFEIYDNDISIMGSQTYPVINLKSDVVVTGEGTESKPFVVNQ